MACFGEGSWGHCRGQPADLFTGIALPLSHTHTHIYIQARDRGGKVKVDSDPHGWKRLWEKQENSRGGNSSTQGGYGLQGDDKSKRLKVDVI